jgi:pyruvate/2-oxoglutarate dehydrogenase complex dihydrolipoamide acyltransferase (E2) component
VTNPIEVLVPDIGGFKDVSVIDVLVKDGQQIDKETPLITIETEKAAMDVPAPFAGRIAQVKLKQGDKVSEGSLILLVEPAAAAAPAEKAQATAAQPVAPAPAAGSGRPLQRPPRLHRHPPRQFRQLPHRRRARRLRSTNKPSQRPTPVLPCANSRANWAPTWAASPAPVSRAASRTMT